MLLSIDIGVKNLGVCVLEWPEGAAKVAMAEVHNIDGGTIRETIDNLIQLVAPLFDKFSIETVLIEQQPLRHARMLSLMYGLYGAMRGTGRDVRIVSPRLRVSYLGLNKSATYAQRKRASVVRVKELFGEGLLQDCGKKLDDVADAVLQGLAWKNAN